MLHLVDRVQIKVEIVDKNPSYSFYLLSIIEAAKFNNEIPNFSIYNLVFLPPDGIGTGSSK